MKLNAICHNCFEFVFPGYWHFENGVRRVSEDVLLDPDGLPHIYSRCLFSDFYIGLAESLASLQVNRTI